MRPLYLALSGGGGHAAAHVGCLMELGRAGVEVAGMAGVSGGALVAAAWAGGADPEKLVELGANLHPWMWVRGWGGGLLSGSRLGALIDEALPVATFDGLSVPLWVLATDVDSGKGVIFKEGPLRDVVRASCSFPGVFPPMVLSGSRFYDGGVSQVVPVAVAREMAGSQGTVVALDCTSGSHWPKADSFVALTLRAGLTALRGRTRGELEGADLAICPQLGQSAWMQPRRIPHFFEAGRQAMRDALPEVRRLIEG